MKKTSRKDKPAVQTVHCIECKHGCLVQFFRGNVDDPMLSECQLKPKELRQEREVARYHTCKNADYDERWKKKPVLRKAKV